MTNKSGYINLRLCAEVPFDTVCARCLKTIRKVQSVSLDKTVAVKGTLEDENADEVVDDYLLIEDGFLDVASPVLEQLMLSLPIKSLCKEDCAGLCPRNAAEILMKESATVLNTNLILGLPVWQRFLRTERMTKSKNKYNQIRKVKRIREI